MRDSEIMEDLFGDIPREARTVLDLPPGISASEVEEVFRDRLEGNRPYTRLPCFLGVEQSPRAVLQS